MAWRPTEYLLEGELDNTTPGKVTGWLRFAGKDGKVTLELEGNFHRDIRGATIRLKGEGREDDPGAAASMEGFADHQAGKVGDITAGLPPHDYGKNPYCEWYSEANGRVVLELDPDQVEVVGRPIPACESDPISRQQQASNMAEFLGSLSAALQVPAAAVGGPVSVVSDPQFTHWVVEQGQIVGEARSVKPASASLSFAYVRLFHMPESAEYGYIETVRLRSKNG